MRQEYLASLQMYSMGHGHLAGLSRSGLAGLAVASSDHSRGLPLTMLHAYRLHSALLERGGRGGGGGCLGNSRSQAFRQQSS